MEHILDVGANHRDNTRPLARPRPPAHLLKSLNESLVRIFRLLPLCPNGSIREEGDSSTVPCGPSSSIARSLPRSNPDEPRPNPFAMSPFLRGVQRGSPEGSVGSEG
eukprot:963732-Prorocentrum_minimum.AAC.1